MNPDYWLNRWTRNQIGWHQPEPEPNLITHFSELKPSRVFVPLCGKSRDLTWLVSQGHEVVAVELSKVACDAYFAENGIPHTNEVGPKFTIYSAERIKIFQGDFFDLTRGDIGPIDAVYDRAALIALPPEARRTYSAHMTRLAQACSEKSRLQFLQIVLERTPPDYDGPPYSIGSAELNALYGANFKIERITRELVDMGNGQTSNTMELVYRLAFL